MPLAEVLDLTGLNVLGWPDRTITDTLSVHHTATFPPIDDYEGERRHIQSIDVYHRVTKPWGGCGYHVLAFPSGRFWVANGNLLIPRAGVKGHNKHTVHLVLVGTFTHSSPSAGTLAAAREGVAFLRGELGRLLIRPHNKMVNTVCPGTRWAEWGPSLEQEDAMPEVRWQTRAREIAEEQVAHHQGWDHDLGLNLRLMVAAKFFSGQWQAHMGEHGEVVEVWENDTMILKKPE